MVHNFICNDGYFVFDSENGALIEVDALTYALMNGESLPSDSTSKEISEAKAEIKELIDEGIIDAKPNAQQYIEKSMEVKSMCLHISHDCNLRCKYCFAQEGVYHGVREQMTLEIGKKAIDFLIANSGKKHNLELDFFGGEPLMNFDVLKGVVEYGKKRAAEVGKIFKYTVTTNGVLLDEQKRVYLNEEMDNVVMSLDGRKDINDKARPTVNGKGSYEVIIDKFKAFRHIRGNKSYFIRGTFTADNLDFSNDVLHMNDEGFDQVSIEPVVLPPEHKMAIKSEHIEEIKKQYEILAKEYVERRKTDKWFSFFHFAVDLENGPCYRKRITGCCAGSEYLAVAPNGDIYPCHRFVGMKQYLLGNVCDGILKQDIRDELAASTVFTKEKCKNCWAKYLCSGGCSANAIEYSGDINVPYEMACEMMKKRLECAMYVNAREKK
ncbi:MAG: thioether cross-link-forming SCIFF peptide maturase [Clostridia bacterium]